MGIFARAHKVLHFQVLFQGLEEECYLPAILVNIRDCPRAEVEIIRQQDHVFVVFLIVHDNTTQCPCGAPLCFKVGSRLFSGTAAF